MGYFSCWDQFGRHGLGLAVLVAGLPDRGINSEAKQSEGSKDYSKRITSDNLLPSFQMLCYELFIMNNPVIYL